MEWLIDSALSAAGYIVVIEILLGILLYFKKVSLKKAIRGFVYFPILLICVFGLSTLNRPKFDRTPDQQVEQKAYESNIEYKSKGTINKTMSIDDQYKDIVEDTKKKFEY